jgi:hypothetical protein
MNDGFGHLVRYFAHDRRVGGISRLDTQVANLRLSHRPIPVLVRLLGVRRLYPLLVGSGRERRNLASISGCRRPAEAATIGR